MITFTADLSQLHKAAKEFPVASASSLNRVGRSTRSEFSRRVRSKFNIKKTDLDPGIGRPSKATPQNLVSRISLRRKRLSLSKFGAKQSKKGVRVAVRKGERKVIQGSFTADMASGHAGAFRRVGPARLPIREILGPTIAQMVSSTQGNDLDRFIHEKMVTELARNISYMRR